MALAQPSEETPVLDREHIEFVQAQMLPWLRIGAGLARPDAEIKLLSRDDGDGACSVLLRFPAGWSRGGPEHLLADEEFYVLDGEIELNGQVYGQDAYAFLPAGWSVLAMPEQALACGPLCPNCRWPWLPRRCCLPWTGPVLPRAARTRRRPCLC